MRKYWNAFLLTALWMPMEMFSQNGAMARPQIVKTPPTLPILYQSFLEYQLHLEQRADALLLEGRNGEDFRNHYKTVLGFSDPTFAKVHTAALHLHGMLSAKNTEIHDLIVSSHAVVPPGPLPLGYVIPPPPPRLKLLFDDRSALVTAEIEGLRKQLTPAETATLEQFLQHDFAPAVTVGVLPTHPAIIRNTLTELK